MSSDSGETAKSADSDECTTSRSRMGLGVALGVGVGAGIGAAVGDVASGIAVGVPIGVAMGAILDRRRRSTSAESSIPETDA